LPGANADIAAGSALNPASSETALRGAAGSALNPPNAGTASGVEAGGALSPASSDIWAASTNAKPSRSRTASRASAAGSALNPANADAALNSREASRGLSSPTNAETIAASTAPIATNSGTITTNEENGHKVYVNDNVPVAPKHVEAPAPRRSNLEYWSEKEHRWKPVPSANGATMRAARSAAAEVDEYLRKPSKDYRSAGSFDLFRGGSFSAEDIDKAIERAAARHNVDANLVRSVVKVESNFNPNAVSRKGAMGLMQLMPSTARSLNVTNPFDPEQNVDAGVRHLKKLLENYGGDVNLSLAAYNAGQGAVARSAGVPRYRETQDYVRRITDLYRGGSDGSVRLLGMPVRDPIRVQRDEKGVLYISNTD